MRLAVAAPIAMVLTASWASAQQAGPPEFEAVSVKPAASAPMNAAGALGIRVAATGGPGTSDPGRINYLGQTLLNLFMRAYSARAYQISGPSWISQDRFDVVATLPPNTTKEQLALMLRKLLADRFQVVLHQETRELPMYALLVGKNGPKLQESKKDDDPAKASAARPGTWLGAGRLGGHNATMTDLAGVLSAQLNRPVKDLTGLRGLYDFALDFSTDDAMAMGPQAAELSARRGAAGERELPDAPAGPSLLTVIQDQLGLKLDGRKGPIEFFVIDRAEKAPTGN